MFPDVPRVNPREWLPTHESTDERLQGNESYEGRWQQSHEITTAASRQPVMIRANPSAVPSIVSDQQFRSQHETGTSNGALNPEVRLEEEHRMFHGSEFEGSNPIYAYMGTHRSHFGTEQYGRARMQLKGVRGRTTMTGEDSLGARTRPTKLEDVPRMHPAENTNWPIAPGTHWGYEEAQVHGGISVPGNVHRAGVEIPSDFNFYKGSQINRYYEESQRAVEALRGAGIPTTHEKMEQYAQGGLFFSGERNSERRQEIQGPTPFANPQTVPISDEQFHAHWAQDRSNLAKEKWGIHQAKAETARKFGRSRTEYRSSTSPVASVHLDEVDYRKPYTPSADPTL
jgi:hypothetical protein